jgi:hypothetical protein
MSRLDFHIEQKIAQRDSIDLAARRLAAAARLILGDLAAVLADATVQARFRGRVILAHLDLAWGDGDDATVHRLVVERTRAWLLPGAWVLSDRALPLEPSWGLVPVPGASEVGHAERYHRYELRPGP